MEAARLEQDRKMRNVLEGIMTRLGAGPLPLSEVMTPPRGGKGQYAPAAPYANRTQEWLANNSFLPPSSQAGGEPQHAQDREAPATNSRHVAKQTVAPQAVPEAEATRGRAMEAALRGMMSTGGGAMLQLFRNSGHEGVASMLTVEGSGPSTQK